MPKVYVLPKVASATELSDLATLILSSDDCELVEYPTHPQLSPDAAIEACEVLVILLDASTADAAQVREVIADATRLGKRIVGVWSPSNPADHVPQGINATGFATIEMSPQKVQAVICGGVPDWTDHEGESLPAGEMPRHKC